MATNNTNNELSLPTSPPRLLKLCLDYICSHFDKYAPQMSRVNKELKEKLWRFALMEHLIDDHRLPLFFDTYTMKEADLTGCDRISDSSLLYIAKKYNSLQVLNLSFCINITNEGVKSLTQCCGSLHTLTLNHCTIGDPALVAIATHLQNIKSLSLEGCANITDAGVSKIAQKCQDLQYLDISHCKTLTGNAIKAVSSSLTNLVHLDVSWCADSISENTLLKLAKLHKLQFLGTADSKASDHVLHKIMQSCSKLASLDVSFCNSVFQTDKHVKYLTSLTRLNAAGCPISESVLTKMLETAVELRDLDVSYNDLIKESWITNIANTQSLVKQLKSINIGFCKHIHTKHAQQLQQARTELVVYYFAA